MRLISLVLALCGATAAACGSAPTPGPDGPDGTDGPAGPAGPAGPEAPASPATGPDAAATTPPGVATSPGPAGPPAAGTPEGFVPVHASTMLEKLAALGLDPKALPMFQKLTFEQKKKVMPLFKRSLGYEECTGCHQEGDFKKVTANMQVARGMWDNFVVQLQEKGGAPLFCDSCHGGKAEPYDDGADASVIQKFMATEYVGKLERKDGKPHDCKTCHGDKLELEIIEKLWKITAR